jgi:hypothetical protein
VYTEPWRGAGHEWRIDGIVVACGRIIVSDQRRDRVIEITPTVGRPRRKLGRE